MCRLPVGVEPRELRGLKLLTTLLLLTQHLWHMIPTGKTPLLCRAVLPTTTYYNLQSWKWSIYSTFPSKNMTIKTGMR